nr:MAG TPA: terminase small subunit [Caudoviricetes sp.]
MARLSKYKTNIKPRFDEIRKWLELGATEKEVASNLGIAESTYFKLKKENKEFSEFIKSNRKNPIIQIKAAMYKRAIGFEYSEIKTIVDDDGKKREETTVKTALPDTTAGLILLKHWDKDAEWTGDPASLKLKKQELELKKKQAEKEDW